MSDKNFNIDQLFKDYLVGHQSKAPVGAWERLHGELHKGGQTRPVWLWRSVAAAILLLITFSAGYFLSEYQRTTTQQFTLTSPVETPSSEVSVPDSENQINLPEKSLDTVENLTSTGETLPEKSTTVKPENKTGIPVKTPSDQQIAPIEDSKQIQSEGNELLIEDEITFLPNEEREERLKAADAMINPEIPLTDPVNEEATANEVTIPENRLFEDPEFLQQLLIADDEYAFEPKAKEITSPSSNWSIGGRFSPIYSYRSLSEGGYETTGDPLDKSYFNEVESGIFTLAAGISLDYKFSNRWSLGSGMYVSRIGQENDEVLAFATPGASGMYKLSTSAGNVTINPKQFESVMIQQQVSVKDTIPGGYLVSGSFVQNLDYFEVPFIMQYKVTDNKFSIHLKGGLSPGILVNNRSYFEQDGVKIQTGIIENVNPMIINSLVGLGLEYSISHKVSVNLDPAFKYSLSPVNQDSKLSAHPYSFSWFTGISYKFY